MNDLISNLVSGLGVGEDQAKGGVGMVLNLLKDKLDGGDFDQVANLMGGNAGDLMGIAQKFMGNSEASGGMGGLLSGISSVTSALGVNSDALSGLAGLGSLMSGFKALNIDEGKIGGFVEILTGFFQENGSEGLVEKVLGILK